jgi:orotate phosphoribosyltransferase
MTALAKVREPETTALDRVKSELRDIIRDRSFRLGRFTLASGRESDFYCNLKPTMMHPRGANLSGRAFLAMVLAEGAEFVGGLEMGAVPIIASLAAISDIEETPVRTFFVRKQAKGHGTKDVIEGLGPNETLRGAKVLIADDVATTGGSIMVAIEQARQAGANVDTALVLVDREEGATEFLATQGVRLLSVFKAGDLR